MNMLSASPAALLRVRMAVVTSNASSLRRALVKARQGAGISPFFGWPA
jgi:hypothetical protein